MSERGELLGDWFQDQIAKSEDKLRGLRITIPKLEYELKKDEEALAAKKERLGNMKLDVRRHDQVISWLNEQLTSMPERQLSKEQWMLKFQEEARDNDH